jgi:hypothetical protein
MENLIFKYHINQILLKNFYFKNIFLLILKIFENKHQMELIIYSNMKSNILLLPERIHLKNKNYSDNFEC